MKSHYSKQFSEQTACMSHSKSVNKSVSQSVWVQNSIWNILLKCVRKVCEIFGKLSMKWIICEVHAIYRGNMRESMQALETTQAQMSHNAMQQRLSTTKQPQKQLWCEESNVWVVSDDLPLQVQYFFFLSLSISLSLRQVTMVTHLENSTEALRKWPDTDTHV